MSFLKKLFDQKKRQKRIKLKDFRGCAKETIKLFEKALKGARQEKDQKGEARALGSIGNVLYMSGDVQRANEFYEQSLTIWWEITGGSKKWKLEDELGQEYQVILGETLKGATTVCEAALFIARENKDMLEAARISNILSMLFYEQGLLVKALNFAKSAVNIYEKIGNSQNAQLTLQFIALIQEQMSR